MSLPVNRTPIESRAVPDDLTESSLDAHARQLHQASLPALSPQLLAQLRATRLQAQRQAQTSAHPLWSRWGALGAIALSMALATVLGLHYFKPTAPVATINTIAASDHQATPNTMSTALDYRNTAYVLDESPDLYVWLASSDAQPLAME